MKKHYLIGTNEIVTDKAQRITLDYYLICESQKNAVEPDDLYGIRVVKYGEGVPLEQEITPPLSHSRSLVMQMIAKLIKHTVTPISVIEILDDMME